MLLNQVCVCVGHAVAVSPLNLSRWKDSSFSWSFDLDSLYFCGPEVAVPSKLEVDTLEYKLCQLNSLQKMDAFKQVISKSKFYMKIQTWHIVEEKIQTVSIGDTFQWN